MTTQNAVFSGLPTGLTLTKKVFTEADPDVEVTGITGAITERTNAKGQYVVAVTKAAVISGIHTLILFAGSTPVAIGKRTFAGTDGETAIITPEAAALDSATALKINRIEAVTSGTVTGAGTSTEVFVGPSATLTITVDSSGNRSAVVVT
jgi:hypothetical protein